ncbi:MAG: sigma 54-interacting transcriptional regulator [Candidatus Nealsonbacteria bacterium]|nr:sigma 54-interacting transcriptional regulator [Candidatus Nealsonbacteria bacterium]
MYVVRDDDLSEFPNNPNDDHYIRLDEQHGKLALLSCFGEYETHVAKIPCVRAKYTSPKRLLQGVWSFLSQTRERRHCNVYIISVRDRVFEGLWDEIHPACAETSSALAPSDAEELQKRLVGDSPKMKEVRALILKAAKSDVSVLILGETGTGKDVAAKAVHELSQRKSGEFVKQSCPDIGRTVSEAEFFGNTDGAFTGAVQRSGLWRKADQGTVFLNEIADLPLELQAKLLGVLDDGRVRPVGADEDVAVDVRVVSATNRDLQEMQQKGDFRQDLYMRLAILTIRMPALREHPEDISDIVKAIWRDIAGDEATLPEDVLAELRSHTWVGNVRQLAGTLKSLHVTCDTDVTVHHVRDSLPNEQSLALSASPRIVGCAPANPSERFQGRDDETRKLIEFLNSSTSRLLTVAGFAGTGKTCLACHLLTALEGNHLPDGGGAFHVDSLVYVDLSVPQDVGDEVNASPRVTANDVYRDLCKLLPPETSQALLESCWDRSFALKDAMPRLLKYFQHGRTILLLDNFETVMDFEHVAVTEWSEFLTGLLTAPQHWIKTIVTTRVIPQDLVMLQAGRQESLSLEGLSLPVSVKMLREMDADGEARLRDESDEVLQQLASRVRGNPRGLEALAAILKIDRNTSCTRILTNSERFMPDEVARAWIRDAFKLLDPSGQRVIQALAVFRQPVTAAGVQKAVEMPAEHVDVPVVLQRLVKLWFVKEQGLCYSLHPLDQQYALRQITTDDRLALHRRAADFYAGLRKPKPEWRTKNDLEPQLEEFYHLFCSGLYDRACKVLNLIDREYLAAWGYDSLIVELRTPLIGQIPDRTLMQKNLGHLGTSHFALNDFPQAIEYLEQAWAITTEIGASEDEGRWLGNLGLAYGGLGMIWRQKRLLQRALQIAEDHRDYMHEGRWLFNLGYVLQLTDPDTASEYYRRALRIVRDWHDRRFEALSLAALGKVYAQSGDVSAAKETLAEGEATAKRAGVKGVEVACLLSLGEVFEEVEDYPEAVDCYEKALARERELASGPRLETRAAELMLLARLGALYSDLCEPEKAIAQYDVALVAARELDRAYDEFILSVKLADVYLREGRSQLAKDTYKRAIAATQDDRGADRISVLVMLAAVCAYSDQMEEAAGHLQQAIIVAAAFAGNDKSHPWLSSLSSAYAPSEDGQQSPGAIRQTLDAVREAVDRRLEANWFAYLGGTCACLEQTRKAIEFLEQAIRLAREVRDRACETRSLTALAECAMRTKKWDQARGYFEEACKLARSSGDRDQEACTLIGLGRVYMLLGETRKALQQYECASHAMQKTDNQDKGLLPLLTAIGSQYVDLHEPDKAISFLERASHLAHKTENEVAECQLLSLLGAACYLAGDSKRAIEYYERGRTIAEYLSLEDQKALALFNIGDAYHLAGDLDKAESYYASVIDLTEECVDYKSEAGLGVVFLHKGNEMRAQECFTRCASLTEKLVVTSPDFYPEYATLAMARLALGDTREGLDTYTQALKELSERVALEGGSPWGPIRYAICDLEVLKRAPTVIPGLDTAIEMLQNALGDAGCTNC